MFTDIIAVYFDKHTAYLTTVLGLGEGFVSVAAEVFTAIFKRADSPTFQEFHPYFEEYKN